MQIIFVNKLISTALRTVTSAIFNNVNLCLMKELLVTAVSRKLL
jgi:hypothetical protein